MLFIPKRMRPCQRISGPARRRCRRDADRWELPPWLAGGRPRDEGLRNGRKGRAAETVSAAPWRPLVYITVKYDTRSAVPALLITRLVTA